MTLSVVAEPIPLTVGADGVARVTGTRVTLDTIVRAFKRGDTAGVIAAAYSTLKLADVYAVISYYLRHEAEVDSYLRWRQQQVDQAHQLIASRSDRQAIRERLRARRAQQRNP